jgi:DNA-binding beta-propeller fold protein YncE
MFRAGNMKVFTTFTRAFAGVVAILGVIPTALADPLPSHQFTLHPVMTFGSEGFGPGQFKYVEDFALSRDGRLLVTDAGHAWVQVFDPHTGAYISRFGGKGEDDHNLEKPEGIAVDPDGYIFIADYNTGYIKKYSPTREWLLTFSEYGPDPGQTMKTEFMTIKDNRLYVPEAGNQRISVFDLAGTFLFTFGKPGAGPAMFNTPEAVRFGPDGNLYVTDLRNDRIQVFDRDGNFIRAWGQSGSGKGQLKSPSGLAIDRDGRVFVAEIGNNRVQVFDLHGKLLTAFGSSGSGAGQFSNLHGLLFDEETRRLYVADTGNNRVQVLELTYTRAP